MSARPQWVEDDSTVETVLGRLSRHDIEALTSKNAFSKGEKYWRQGRVVSLAVEDAVIRAKVRGSRAQPYSVTIDLEDDADVGAPGFMTSCTCPVGFDCKHVAAALLAATARSSAAPAVNHRSRQRTAQQLPLPVPEFLQPELSAWIADLARLSETEDYPPDVRQRLIYVLDLEEPASGVPHLVVRATSVKLGKDDSFTDERVFDPQAIRHRNLAKYVRPSDRDILALLLRMRYAGGAYRGTLLAGESGVAALKAMIGTGRARWRSVTGAIVTQGPALSGRLAWRLTADGSHLPDFALNNAGTARVVRLAPPWYADAETGTVGPVETEFTPRVAGGILSAPPIPASQTKLLRAAIESRLKSLAIIEPPDVGPPLRIKRPPVPTLKLMARNLPIFSYYSFGGMRRNNSSSHEQVLLGRLFFRYDSIEIRGDDPRHKATFARDGALVEVVRNRTAERKALARLANLGFVRLAHERPYVSADEYRNDFTLAQDEDRTAWYDLLHRQAPALRADGWVVEVEPDFPIRLAHADDVLAELREGSGIDWFELELGVTIDGERVDLVPAILAALRQPGFAMPAGADAAADDQAFYLPLGDGRILAMPAGRLRPILTTLHELFGPGTLDAEATQLGFALHDAGHVAELEAATRAAGVVWQGGERLRELGRLLRETGAIPRAEVPASFAATLRPYQARGVDWMQFLRAAGLGGVLADDMGLGKTVQALAHLAIEKASGRMDRPALVICPTSVVTNWRREAERFAPELKVLTLHGLDRKSRFADIAAHDLILTTYPLLARDHAVLKAQDWHAVMLDEAQTIKNPDAATTRLVGELQARHRLCLTGTPLENNLGELWSLFAFLSPGFLGDRHSFKRHWRTPIEKRGDDGRRRLLARRVRPFLLRRTKAEVAAELPPKTEIVEPIEMDKAQRDLYESIRLAMHAKVRAAIAAKGLARSRIDVLDALLKLRQVCCDPRLVKLQAAAAAKARSAKLDRLLEMLPELIEEGRRVLLFSQFTSMLALIERELRAISIPYVLLTGDTRDRETPIRRFQAGEVPLFLISLKAGGVGLTLTAADTVIHYDPWWNPAVEDQATDRAHRLGQDKPVFVHKLTMLASIEEKMETLKARKRALAAGLFDSEAGSTLDLTEADIEDLFAAA